MSVDAKILNMRIIGIFFGVISIFTFVVSLTYMINAVNFNDIGSLAETVFFGLLGVAFSISGTLILLKSFDFT